MSDRKTATKADNSFLVLRSTEARALAKAIGEKRNLPLLDLPPTFLRRYRGRKCPLLGGEVLRAETQYRGGGRGSVTEGYARRQVLRIIAVLIRGFGDEDSYQLARVEKEFGWDDTALSRLHRRHKISRRKVWGLTPDGRVRKLFLYDRESLEAERVRRGQSEQAYKKRVAELRAKGYRPFKEERLRHRGLSHARLFEMAAKAVDAEEVNVPITVPGRRKRIFVHSAGLTAHLKTASQDAPFVREYNRKKYISEPRMAELCGVTPPVIRGRYRGTSRYPVPGNVQLGRPIRDKNANGNLASFYPLADGIAMAEAAGKTVPEAYRDLLRKTPEDKASSHLVVIEKLNGLGSKLDAHDAKHDEHSKHVNKKLEEVLENRTVGRDQKRPAKRGRRTLPPKEQNRRLELLAKWETAAGARVAREKFCADEGVTIEYLHNAQIWNANRRKDGR